MSMASSPSALYVGRERLVRAFLIWDQEFQDSPHKFLSSTAAGQMPSRKAAEASADYLLQLLTQEVR